MYTRDVAVVVATVFSTGFPINLTFCYFASLKCVKFIRNVKLRVIA